jgi:basic amino acid/polyamine antiporter, APA family
LHWYNILVYGRMGELKRTLNLAEVVFFASGVILGAGIYTIIGKAAGAGGNMLWLSFAIAAFTALLTLFSYAELISVYPSSGGEFTFVEKAAGVRWAYVVALMVALSGMISSATISLGFAGYLSELAGFPSKITALAIIALILVVNVLGIKHSSAVNIVFTLLETGGLLFVIFTAAPALGEVSLVEAPPGGFHGLLAGAAICFFAFTGFEDAVKLAEETKDPSKNIPRGLFISAAVVMVVYICVSLVVVSMIPFGELANSESPLSTVVEKRFGTTGATIIAIVALFSTANSLLSNMLGASRVIYNVGKKSRALSFFGRVLSKNKTPALALLAAAGVASVFSLIGDIKVVALITNFFVFVTFLIINITVIYLRRTQKDLKRPFRVPGAIGSVPVITVVAIVMVSVLMGYTVYGLATGLLQD